MGFKELILGSSYDVTVVCTNCSRTVRAQIRQGTTVEQWARNMKCKNCKTRGNFQKADY